MILSLLSNSILLALLLRSYLGNGVSPFPFSITPISFFIYLSFLFRLRLANQVLKKLSPKKRRFQLSSSRNCPIQGQIPIHLSMGGGSINGFKRKTMVIQPLDMVLERWTLSPPIDFMSSFEVWIRIRNIPATFFIVDTMHELGSAVGKVEEIAYDPKVSHTKEYVRVRVIFNTDNPVRITKNLNLPTGEKVVINYEYGKIWKRCFHCLRLTHEKPSCPWLRKSNVRSKEDNPLLVKIGANSNGHRNQEPSTTLKIMDDPPGFPPIFPELSKQDQQMTLQYISHSDATERLARIRRVQQSIEDKA